MILSCRAGGKPSTRLPPGKLVEHSCSPNLLFFEPRAPKPSLQPTASSLHPPASTPLPAVSASSHDPPGDAPEAQNPTRLDSKMPQSGNHPRPLPELSGHRAGALGFPSPPGTSRNAPVASKTRPSEGFARLPGPPSWNSRLPCTPLDYSQACLTSLNKLSPENNTKHFEKSPIIAKILIFSFLELN